MTVKKFLKEVSDKEGPLKVLAEDLMERMTQEDFEALCAQMKEMQEVWEKVNTLAPYKHK